MPDVADATWHLPGDLLSDCSELWRGGSGKQQQDAQSRWCWATFLRPNGGCSPVAPISGFRSLCPTGPCGATRRFLHLVSPSWLDLCCTWEGARLRAEMQRFPGVLGAHLAVAIEHNFLSRVTSPLPQVLGTAGACRCRLRATD